VQRVLATLERQPGVFQRLLHVWDAGNSWVLVQELGSEWKALRETFADPLQFSEEKLRRVVFQVASALHFLHRHGLSLAGELVHYDAVVRSFEYWDAGNAVFTDTRDCRWRTSK
jgi:hypothetical protein